MFSIAPEEIQSVSRVVVKSGWAYSDLKIELRSNEHIYLSLTQPGGSNMAGMSDRMIEEVVATLNRWREQ